MSEGPLRTDEEMQRLQAERRQYLRLVGKLEAAKAILKDASGDVAHVDKRTAEAVHEAERFANKAMLAAWEYADG